ncbi:PspC domain-containing protein [Bacteroides gallinarum]|uniref:PspC domain-containing protein n=1 Tax=Bacteroides gallinarum TaxID=376806 RepID=UPI0003A83146|nr:PspC domain-containing protein [Bacteroides gallinarum]
MTNGKQRLTRPRTGRMIAGVCAGLADFFGLDVSLVRILYVLATVFTVFSGVIIYTILLIIIPEEPNRLYQND